MNYKVLYRKYRPDNFDAFVGQQHVVNILKNSISENKIAHAYLFSGPRGTGKTTTARILAKSVNCLNIKDGMACDECEHCKSFNGNPDIIEIDAASNNGVDEIRELINNVKIMPTGYKYKVYIIDEVHMLSQSAFNALLLTLEEPPEHVIFILATTNIESVPITILSRCQRFDFKKISDADILNRLKYICDQEKIKYTEEGLQEITSLSDGGLRDALSILDQLSKENKEITIDLVATEIGTVSNKKLEELLKSVDNNNIDDTESVINELQATNLNYKVIIKKLIYILSEISVKILKGTDEWNMSFDTCKLLVYELNDLINKININVDPYLLIKMTFLGKLSSGNKYYVNQNISREIKKDEEKIEVKETKKENNNISKESKMPENKLEKDDAKNQSNLVEVRVNNCFVGATKQLLSKIKDNWNSFIDEIDDNIIKGLITDTLPVASSDEYTIFSTNIPHKDLEINKQLKTIEECYNKKYNESYKFIFINSVIWENKKEEYIKNLKNGFKYELIEEHELQENEDMSDIAGVFDLDKIEIE